MLETAELRAKIEAPFLSQFSRKTTELDHKRQEDNDRLLGIIERFMAMIKHILFSLGSLNQISTAMHVSIEFKLQDPPSDNRLEHPLVEMLKAVDWLDLVVPRGELRMVISRLAHVFMKKDQPHHAGSVPVPVEG